MSKQKWCEVCTMEYNSCGDCKASKGKSNQPKQKNKEKGKTKEIQYGEENNEINCWHRIKLNDETRATIKAIK